MSSSPVEFPPELIKILSHVDNLAMLTGSGVSAESGIPTFREAQTGLWARYEPHELATPEAFQRNPQLVWDWYQWRREIVLNAQPNQAHYAIAQIERCISLFTLITQNVDGLHAAAGSQNIIELHGNLHRSKCFTEGVIIDHWQDSTEKPPRCPNCGGFLRPDVVWFGEMLTADHLSSAQHAAQTCEVFFSIGTSSVVEPAASFPYLALESGATIIEVNTQATPLSRFADYVFRDAAGIVLPEFARLICSRKPAVVSR